MELAAGAVEALVRDRQVFEFLVTADLDSSDTIGTAKRLVKEVLANHDHDFLVYPKDIAAADLMSCMNDVKNFAPSAVAVIKKLRRPRRCFAQAVVPAHYEFGHTTPVPLLLPSTASSSMLYERCATVSQPNLAFVKDLGAALIDCATGMRRTVVLRGASGSGKTHNAIAVAHLAEHIDGTCLYVCLTHVRDEVEGLQQKLLNAGGDTRARDAATRQQVLAWVESAVPPMYRAAPPGGTRHAKSLVIVFDEAGAYPLVVRSLCRLFHGDGLRGDIARLLNISMASADVRRSDGVDGAAKRERVAYHAVHTIITGTGVEGHQRETTASEPDSYVLMLAAPRAWDTLQVSLPPNVKAALTEPTRLDLVQTLRMLESNARLAALFCRACSAQGGGTPENTLVSSTPLQCITASVYAAMVQFKALNGLAKLGSEYVVTELINALCAQTQRDMDAAVWSGLGRGHGLLVDYAVLVNTAPSPGGTPSRRPSTDARSDASFEDLIARGQTSSTEPIALRVPKPFTVRFAADEAVSMMAHMLVSGTEVTSGGDGFERMAARFLAFAALFATADVPFDVGRVRSISAAAADPPPRGWEAPLTLVEALQCAGRKRRRIVLAKCVKQITPAAVRTKNGLSRVLKATPFKSAATNALEALRSPALDVVLVNTDGAAYADVIACVAGRGGGDAAGAGPAARRLVLCQCKFYATTTLTALDVFAELHKMGHRCDLSVAAAAIEWLASRRGTGKLSHAAIDLIQPHVTLKTNKKTGQPFTVYNKSHHFLAVMRAHVRGDALADLFGVAPERALRAANPATSQLEKLTGGEPLFVLMVHGLPPRPLFADVAADGADAPPVINDLPPDAAGVPAELVPQRDVRLLWAPLTPPSVAAVDGNVQQAAAAARLLGYYPLPLASEPPPVDSVVDVKGGRPPPSPSESA